MLLAALFALFATILALHGVGRLGVEIGFVVRCAHLGDALVGLLQLARKVVVVHKGLLSKLRPVAYALALGLRLRTRVHTTSDVARNTIACYRFGARGQRLVGLGGTTARLLVARAFGGGARRRGHGRSHFIAGALHAAARGNAALEAAVRLHASRLRALARAACSSSPYSSAISWAISRPISSAISAA